MTDHPPDAREKRTSMPLTPVGDLLALLDNPRVYAALVILAPTSAKAAAALKTHETLQAVRTEVAALSSADHPES